MKMFDTKYVINGFILDYVGITSPLPDDTPHGSMHIIQTPKERMDIIGLFQRVEHFFYQYNIMTNKLVKCSLISWDMSGVFFTINYMIESNNCKDKEILKMFRIRKIEKILE